MVARLESIQRAVCSFMETEILSKTPQGKRLLIGAMIMVAPKFIEKKYVELEEYIQMLELGTADGSIDIDKTEKTLLELMGKYGNYQMDIAGTRICLDQQDVRKIADLARSM